MQPNDKCFPTATSIVCSAQRLLVLLIVLLASHPSSALAENKKRSNRPNFVVVLADDLGYGDLHCYGNQAVKSPNLDRFAKKGLLLTSCYAAHANCSPSRAGLMTGRTPTRVGVNNWIPMQSPMHLRQSEITIATLLRQAGYATCHVGKWHLNGMFNLEGQPQPSDHGFDHWFSTQNNALPNHRDPYNFVRNSIPMGPQIGYSSEIVVDEAIYWLKKGRDPAKPFFLFVCFHEPHEPIASHEKFAGLYPFDDPSRRAHHGNISQMDFAFGRLMTALDELNLDENTVIIFTSDNGPAITNIHPHGSAGPLRAKKGHLYEGGIRVPGIIYWAGHTKAGAVSDEPVSGVDVLPTFCDIAGIAAPKDRAIDGTSFLPIFNGRPIQRKTPLYWHFNGARSKVKVAMRVGEWSIVATITGPEQKPGGGIRAADQKALRDAELKSFELYNLRADIGQKNDLSAKEPQQLNKMVAMLRKMYREVRDAYPIWPEWEFARYEAQRIEWPAYKGKKIKSKK